MPYKITALSPSGPVTLGRGYQSRRLADMKLRIFATDYFNEYFAFCIDPDNGTDDEPETGNEDIMATETYRPKFHKNNTITYWHEQHGWIHRVHPLKITYKTLENWEHKDYKRRFDMLTDMGYVQRNGKWELTK